MRSRVFDLRLDAGCALGESPVWIAEEGRLAFVDIPRRTVHLFDPLTGAHETLATREDVGCVAPVRGGGLLVGLRSGIERLGANGVCSGRLAQNPENPATSRFNDGKVDPRGRMLLGTIDEPKAGGAAALYRLGHAGLERLKGGLLTSNGLAFSPDGRRLYHADTPRFTVYVHDYDPESGEMGPERVFARLEARATDRARPDGGAVDAEGCYWSALYEGARVARFDPDGRLIEAVAVPARKPTMPAFGGTDLRTLFLTTAADGEAPGGGLYGLDVDVPGAPVPPFDPRTGPDVIEVRGSTR